MSETKTSPNASTATPTGWLYPEPTVEMTVGVKRGLVEYWNSAVVVEPFGLTVALSVAPVSVIGLAAPVATVGRLLSSIFRSSDSSVSTAGRTRRQRRLDFLEAAADSAGGSVSVGEGRREGSGRSGSCLMAGSAGVGRGLRQARMNAQWAMVMISSGPRPGVAWPVRARSRRQAIDLGSIRPGPEASPARQVLAWLRCSWRARRPAYGPANSPR